MIVKKILNRARKITAAAQDFKPNKKLSLHTGINFWQNTQLRLAQIKLFIPKNHVAKQKRYHYTQHEYDDCKHLFLFFFTHN